MTNCIFCKIANHEAPAKVEFENDFVIAFPSISPAAETHVLIVPKTHIPTFMDIKKEHTDIYMEMTQVTQNLIKSKGIENGYKLVINGGKYQAIPHLHWHLLAGKLENEDKPESRT